MSNYYLLKKGEFAYNKSYSNGFDYGSVKRLNAYEQGCLSTLYICFGITSDEVESDYLECFFDTLKWYGDVSMICAEGARNHGLLNVDTKGFFDEVTIDLPRSLEEQKKISAYLNALDNLVTLHQRKPTDLYKIVINDWEQRKLSEIADKVSEKNKNNEYNEPLTNSAEQGIISQKDYFDREVVNEDNLDGYYIVRDNDFVYNPRVSVSAPVGPINRNRLGRNGVMSPLYTVFRTHDIDSMYLEYYYKTTKWHRFMKLNGDSGARFDRFTISSTLFMEMPIPYPSIEEQEKIGVYFDNLDSLITLHQRKF